MRYVDVRLPKDYVNLLRMYGTLEKVTQLALNMVHNETLPPIQEMDSAPSDKRGCGKYIIAVNDEQFCKDCEIYGANNPRVSIRRLLYYIVDNEIYTDWELRTTPLETDDKYKERINKCILIIKTLMRKAPPEHIKYLEKALEYIQMLDT